MTNSYFCRKKSSGLDCLRKVNDSINEMFLPTLGVWIRFFEHSYFIKHYLSRFAVFLFHLITNCCLHVFIQQLMIILCFYKPQFIRFCLFLTLYFTPLLHREVFSYFQLLQFKLHREFFLDFYRKINILIWIYVYWISLISGYKLKK